MQSESPDESTKPICIAQSVQGNRNLMTLVMNTTRLRPERRAARSCEPRDGRGSCSSGKEPGTFQVLTFPRPRVLHVAHTTENERELLQLLCAAVRGLGRRRLRGLRGHLSDLPRASDGGTPWSATICGHVWRGPLPSRRLSRVDVDKQRRGTAREERARFRSRDRVHGRSGYSRRTGPLPNAVLLERAVA